MKLIFLGTPDFSVPALKAIAASEHEVLAVVTQPDKPVGRSGKLCPTPVKQAAEELGLKVLQYEKIRRDGVDDLIALKPDIMVTCAFGQILSKQILDIAPHGVINVHASLLPKYRGAAPIQWAVINGDEQTGVTIMQTEEGVDTGDMILVEKTPIYPEETAGELFDRLALIGANAVVRALDLIESGTAKFEKQNEALSTHVRMLKKEDGVIDFSLSASKIVNFVRGMNPWPCAFTYLNGKLLKVFKAEIVTEADLPKQLSPLNPSAAKAGEVLVANGKNGLIVKAGENCVRLSVLQEEGGKRMLDCAFLLGHEIPLGSQLKNDR